MDPKQRFRRDHPCPVCGGHEGMPQGEGRRCYGFISDDGLYAHCTRENCAGNLEQNMNSNAFAHYLDGECACGLVHELGPAWARTTSGGNQGPTSVYSYRHPELGRPSQLWPYRYADGELACYVARFEESDRGKTFRPLISENGSWRPKGIPGLRPLYNLPALRSDPDAPVLVVEGEKTSDATRMLLPSYVSITSMHGAKAPHETDWSPLKGRDVVIWPDNDPMGLQYAQDVATLVLKGGASSVRIVQLPQGLPAKWDLADPVPHDVDVGKLLAEAEPVALEEEERESEGKTSGRGRSLSAGDRLLKSASEEAKLFCDGEEAYADVLIDGHRETLPIRSTGFERWLRRLSLERTGKGATKEALTQAMLNLDAQAARAGQRRVYLRTATHEGRIYIDLCDDTRRVVEIDGEGWRVQSAPPAVRFRRTKTTEPLPEPVAGHPREGLRILHRYLNIEDRDFVLCVAWLLAALIDAGPYPLLVLTGEQGSAKSTAARLFRSLVDPARPPTRGMPGSERDIAIAAEDHLTESALMTAFEEAAPIILGALLTSLSEGLRRYDNVQLKHLPRMADFCKWAVACETAYWRPGTCMEAYNEAQTSATEDVHRTPP